MKNNCLNDQLSSEKFTHELDVSEESGGDLDFLLLVLAFKHCLRLLCEELMEAFFAVLE